jgi:methionine sulfoxide reductase catalytic subunit
MAFGAVARNSRSGPWAYFPLSQLMKIAEPLVAAKCVRDRTGQSDGRSQCTFLSVALSEGRDDRRSRERSGIDIQPSERQAPGAAAGGLVRGTLPWKYGFKSAKALIKISSVEQRPSTFWESIGPSEYGVWAKVRPVVPHARRGQASDRLLASDERVPTRTFNGYAEQVAGLYTDHKTEKLFT